MKKLINLNIIKANNEICVWREDVDYDIPFRDGIESEDAMGDYNIPRYVAIGIYDDGSVMVGGINSLNDINRHKREPARIFSNNQFLHFVTLFDVKAFVRFYARVNKDESYVRNMIYKGLVKAGVTIWDDAKKYLLEYDNLNDKK